MEDAKALNDRGWKHLCQRCRHEALDDFSRAIKLDPNLAEAYNNRSIARRIADEDAAEDEDWADALTMHDLEAQIRLRQQRKWMCIGYSARGEPEGENTAADADFLISFASPDREENNRILHELKTGVSYSGGIRPVTFCTDKSLGMGLHINEGQEMRRWNPIFSDLDQPRQLGEYPPWFMHYKKAAEETRHGLLILQLTDSYLQSKACRWEFGYVRKPELVHVYVPSDGKSPGRIVTWDELMEDAELCKQLFGELLEQEFQGNGDAENPFAKQGTLMRLDKMAKTAVEQEHQAWCELPFRQLAYSFARNAFGEKDPYTIVSAEMLIRAYLDTGFPEKALQIGKSGTDLLEQSLEKAFGLDPKYCSTLSSFLARNLLHLGLAHGRLGDIRKQKDLLERSLSILEQHFGEDHPELVLTLGNLGDVHGRLGNHRQSKHFFERDLRIREQHLRKDHHDIGITLTGLGQAHTHLDNYGQAKNLLERALKILEQHYGKEHPKVAVALACLGIAHGSWGNNEEKKNLLERALKIYEQHYEKENTVIGMTMFNLGVAHYCLGDPWRAKEFVERAFKIFVQHGDPFSEEVQRFLSQLKAEMIEISEEVQRFLAVLKVKMAHAFTAATDEDRDLLEAIRRALQDDEDLQRALALSLESSEECLEELSQDSSSTGAGAAQDVQDPELQEALALSMSPLDAGGAQLVK